MIDQQRHSVLSCLQDCSIPDRQIATLNELIAQEGKQTCQSILNVLAHLDLDIEAAENCWHDVVRHHGELSDLVGRPLSLQTAMCDYFCSVRKHITHPKIIDLQLFEEALQDLSCDYLTGLSNRKEFETHLQQEFAKAERRGRPLSLLFLDLDDFKRVNDTFGHQAGDLVLKRTSSIIEALKRVEDTAARYGGEEIAIILPDTDKYQAKVLAERIREQIEKARISYAEDEIRITISAGIASYPQDAVGKTALVSSADHALYSAKRNGKNIVSLYQPEKRRYLRIDFTQQLEVKFANGKKGNIRQTFTPKGKNLCVGGILFESNKDIEIDTCLEIKIDLGTGTPLPLHGKVARVEKMKGGKYDIGVFFQGTGGNAMHTLSKYICQHFEWLGQVCLPTQRVFERTGYYSQVNQ
ncbi:MAG: GGDEF domain-containing protein [Proteobacteria bacterium]|nr:GGDEF domain-containing protein [Pseudomonadota bacterium]MBU4119598.1 GGDEF domain-containing protein [Pseudomonadota bacterium]